MKRTRLLWLAAAAAVLFASISAGAAYATTSCFVDTNAAAACWMKANGLASGSYFYPTAATTRLQAAAWLKNQSQIPPTTGMITVSAGFANWRTISSTANLQFSRYANLTYVTNPVTGFDYLGIQPSIPTVLYGRKLFLRGVEMCYAASANANLTWAGIYTYTQSSGPGAVTQQFSDSTIRTDTACRYYVLSTPVALGADDGADLYIGVNWTTAGTNFSLGRTTFVFSPSATKAPAPTGAIITNMQEGGPQPKELIAPVP